MDDRVICSVNESTLEKLLICDDENIFLTEPWYSEEFFALPKDLNIWPHGA